MAESAEDFKIVDNIEGKRFELRHEGHTGVLTYSRDGRSVYYLHTEVPEPARNSGLGAALVRHGLEDARSRGLVVVPICPFVRQFIAEHPDYDDVLGSR